VLVGTTSIENSELLSGYLERDKLPHQVLNAKQHAREAEIIAQAGRPKMVTIATNMAGRGTDIVLGGNAEKQIELLHEDASLDEASKEQQIARIKSEWQQLHQQVLDSGGLHIIGTERHESRRVDNQLRGRSGRQGDPGSSRFFLSLEDPLLRIFASDRVTAIMNKFKLPEGEAIEHSWVTRAIENAQRKVEARNFDMRKQILEYDDVSNDQRKVIYQQRSEFAGKRGYYRNHPGDARGRAGKYHQPVHSAALHGGAMGCAGAGKKTGCRFSPGAAAGAVAGRGQGVQ